jgi:hydroxymethylpyrimidine pyrophosphatase-like HAD family hydrolase
MFNGAALAMRELADSLRRDARGWAVSLTEYVHRDFSLIDVTAPGATKGHALAWRAEQLGLTRDQVMAVGDNFNDIEMLEYAGTPVLMANAVEGLRRPGWHVTGHQDDAGLARAIRELALGQRLS